MVDAPRGSLVSYSTAPGAEAVDGDNGNSPFTTALIEVGQEPGLPIEQALKRVRLAVSKATDPMQIPYESSSLTTEFAFFPAQAGREKPTLVKAGETGNSAAPGSAARSVEAWKKELRSRSPRDAYEIVIREDKVEGYQAYLALHPSQPTVPAVRTILVRRQLMIAWYTAVTINTTASYQAFLANWGSSDYAASANRLLERTLTRSVSAAGSAFATAPACPCSQPANPLPRQRRTGLQPTQNAVSTPSGPSAPTAGTTTVVNTPPSVIYPSPAPPIVVAPPRPPIVHIPPRPPRGHGKPTGGNDKPSGGADQPSGSTGKPAGNDTPTGRDKPRATGGWSNDKPKVTLGTGNDRSPALLNPGSLTNYGQRNRKASSPQSSGTAMSMFPAVGIRPNPSVKQQSFGATGMSRSQSFRPAGASPGVGRMPFGGLGIR
jgi:hypothetical protein